MDSISFKATCVNNNASIKALNENGEYVEKKVSFVKRDPYSESDYNSIVDIGALWGDVKPNYVVSMLHHSDIIDDDKERDVYFLTEQTDNFGKIIPEKVLGMIEITKCEKYNKINYIQTRPDCVFGSQNRKTKGVGWAMLVMADKLSQGKDIILNARRKMVEFYKKYGYVVTYDKCINPKMVLQRTKIHK